MQRADWRASHNNQNVLGDFAGLTPLGRGGKNAKAEIAGV